MAILLSDTTDALPLTWGMLAVIGSVAASTGILTWFVREQFSKQRATFFRIISRHNREDDDRFALLDDAIWHLREQVAQVGGRVLPERRTLPRRRYLLDDSKDDDNYPGGNGSSDG